jgi:hypothetical protein
LAEFDKTFMKKKVAFIVAHPAHLLTVLGLLLEFKPQILLLTHAFAGAGRGQADLIRSGFKMAEMEGHVTDLEIDEAESYRSAIAGNFSFHEAMLTKIVDWLEEHETDVVYGDAYEVSNYQHDVGRLLLDQAIKIIKGKGRSIKNYEFPLSACAQHPDAALQFGRFIEGKHQDYVLNPQQSSVKRKVVEMAINQDHFISRVAPQFPGMGVEQYRLVPEDRNYLIPPSGLSLYYDKLGQERVAAGHYSQAITFSKHFCPLVERIKKL